MVCINILLYLKNSQRRTHGLHLFVEIFFSIFYLTVKYIDPSQRTINKPMRLLLFIKVEFPHNECSKKSFMFSVKSNHVKKQQNEMLSSDITVYCSFSNVTLEFKIKTLHCVVVSQQTDMYAIFVL